MKTYGKKPLSLRYKLLLWIIPIVIIYTWVLTAISSTYIASSTRNSLEKTLGQTAEITSEHITESITNNKKLTTLLASRVGSMYEDEITMDYDKLDVETFADEISKMGMDYGFLHMMVADMDGFNRTPLHTDLRENAAAYYLEIVDGGRDSYVSDVTVDKGSFAGKYVLNYSAPIKNEAGDMIGVLVCKGDAAELSQLVANISVGDGGITFIMDNNGQCIAHPDEKLLFSGESFLAYKDNPKYGTLNELWDAMESQASGTMAYDLNGRRIASFCRVDSTNNWSIGVTVSENEFMQEAIHSRKTTTWIALGMIIAVCFILLGLFGFITKSILKVTNRLERLSQGDLSSEAAIDTSSNEAYRLSKAAANLAGAIRNLISDTEYALSEIAKGNLTVKPGEDYPGEFAELQAAIKKNLVKLNDIMQRILRTSEEVARGSAQMASGASGLAQGASEQASSLEELFETVTGLAQRTYEIGGMDKKKLAAIDDKFDGVDEAEAAEKKIEAVETLAEKLTISIKRIEEASSSIRRLASNIESISAETGMLALNASVEATHAGDAGRGFSVIASEIHSLSDKSREAAKDADIKIDSITKAVSRGSQTVDLTVETIGEMNLAMEQVKGALEQISNVVENIAATAEETAAGSEELSAQAEVLKNLVAEFKFHADEGSI